MSDYKHDSDKVDEALGFNPFETLDKINAEFKKMNKTKMRLSQQVERIVNTFKPKEIAWVMLYLNNIIREESPKVKMMKISKEDMPKDFLKKLEKMSSDTEISFDVEDMLGEECDCPACRTMRAVKEKSSIDKIIQQKNR